MGTLDYLSGCGQGWQDSLAYCTLQNGLDELLVEVDLDQVRVAFILGWNFEASYADRPGAVMLFQAVKFEGGCHAE